VGSDMTRYHVVVRGEMGALPPTLADCVSIRSDGWLTVLGFNVKDSSELGGILDRLRDLSVDVVSAEVAFEPGGVTTRAEPSS
jgi:hypothetical protein